VQKHQHQHQLALSALGNEGDIKTKRRRQDIDSFQEWAWACGIQSSEGFELVATPKTNQQGDCYNDEEDVSVQTSQALEAHSPILFIPQEMILSSSKAMAELGESLSEAEQMLRADSTKDNNATLVRHFYIMMKLLLEWQRGPDSPWYPYLNQALPRSFDNGASMTPVCYKCLPPHVAALAQKERAALNQLSAVKRVVSFLDNDTKGNTELWKWAYSVVTTRSVLYQSGSSLFSNEGDLCLIPMLDMFNHDAAPECNNIEFALDDHGNCLVQTNQNVEAGWELCRNYYCNTEGCDDDFRLDPSFLLARYGFVDHSAPGLFCKWTPPHVNEDMKQLGYSPERMFFYKESGDIAPLVWDLLLYQVLMTEEEEEEGPRQQLVQAHIQGDHETKQWLHEQYYALTSELLRQHVATVLQELEELSQKIQSLQDQKNAKEHRRLPLIAEHNQVVQDTFRAVQWRWFEGENP